MSTKWMVGRGKAVIQGIRHFPTKTSLAVAALGIAGCSSLETSPDSALSDSGSVVSMRYKQPAPSSAANALVLASATEATTTSFAAERPSLANASTAGTGIAPPESERLIDLAAALQLAGVDNPTIGLAKERVNESLAQKDAADVLLLPSLTVGANYHKHFGNLQRSPGGMLDVSSQSFYFGAGARTLGGESVMFPGVRIFSHLGDAIYEPLAAMQHVLVRRNEASAVQNTILLEVSEAYLDLLLAESQLEVLRKSEAQLDDVNKLVSNFVREGQSRDGDGQRVKANADLLHRQLLDAEGIVAGASARLTGLLSLDPSVRLHTPGGKIPTVQLIDETQKLDELISLGLSKRPEIMAGMATVQEARTRVRQEQVRPFLPTLSMGYSAGGFGGSSNLATSTFGAFTGRTDVDVFAVWTLQNSGVGNIALTKRASAVLGQAIADLERIRNEVREQISEALADTQAAARQIELARREFLAAEEGFREEYTRVRQNIGRPIEVLDSFKQSVEARQELVRAVMAYNAAQFRLFVAVGATPTPDINFVANPIADGKIP